MASRSFLLCVAVLFAAMVLAGVAAGDAYKKDFADINFITPDTGVKAGYIELTNNISNQLTTLGSLVAVSLSFNMINKERVEGSLKVLSSYPIFRDEIIYGKLLAGLVLVTVVVSTSHIIALAVFLLETNISLSIDLIARVAALSLVGVLLLSIYLGFGLILSISTKDTCLSVLILFLLIGVYNSRVFYYIGKFLGQMVWGGALRVIPGGLYGVAQSVDERVLTTASWFNVFTPVSSYHGLVTEIGSLFRVTGVEQQVSVPLSLLDALLDGSVLISVLILYFVATFVISYVLFTKRDIS